MEEWVLAQLPIKKVKKLTIEEVVAKALALQQGVQLSLPDLYTGISWGEFSLGSRLSVGRKFYEMTKEGGPLHGEFEFIGKVGGTKQARYKRLGGTK